MVINHSLENLVELAQGGSDDMLNIENKCTICSKILQENQRILIISTCKHEFHRNCIEDSLSHSSECPLCKRACELSDLVVKRVDSQIAKNSPKQKTTDSIRGKPRGAMAKKYNTRNSSKSLMQEFSELPNLELSSTTAQVQTTFDSPHGRSQRLGITEGQQQLPYLPNSPQTHTPCLDQNSQQRQYSNNAQTTQSSINMSQLNKLIEDTLTRLLTNLNIGQNQNQNNSAQFSTQPNVNYNFQTGSQPPNINRNQQHFVQQQSGNAYSQRLQQQQNIQQLEHPNVNLNSPIGDTLQQNVNPNSFNNRMNLSSNSWNNEENFQMRSEKITQIIQNWNVKFDGSSNGLNVEEFLYRVRSLTSDHFNGNFNIICKYLHILLTGKARDWYWSYHKKVDSIQWKEFCESLRYQYKDFRSSFDIREDVRNRKMKPGEKFQDFFDSVSSMLDRLETPIPESELVEILTRNLRPDIRHELLFVPILSVAHLRKMVQMRENLLGDEYFNRNMVTRPGQSFGNKRVAELEFPEENTVDASATTEFSVEAVRQGPILTTCWNCDEKGHHWEDCLRDRVVFCYGCGEKRTYKPQCARCATKKLLISKNLKH